MNIKYLGLSAVVTTPNFGSRFPLYLHSPWPLSRTGAAAIGQPFTGSITDELAKQASVEVAL